MQNLIPVITAFFDEDKKVIVEAVGNSMRPLIRHKKDGIILEKYVGQSLAVGDMAFYKRKNGRYVLHRIVGITEDNSFIMLGDNQTKAETEAGIKSEQIIAVPTAVIRGKKTVLVTSKGYKRYARLWSKSGFFRNLNIMLFKFKIVLARIIANKRMTAE